VIAHRGNVGLSRTCQLPKTDAVFAPFREKIESRVHQSRPRPQTGFSTLINPRRFHPTY
jgi:hypothetical protein